MSTTRDRLGLALLAGRDGAQPLAEGVQLLRRFRSPVQQGRRVAEMAQGAVAIWKPLKDGGSSTAKRRSVIADVQPPGELTGVAASAVLQLLLGALAQLSPGE